jgi:hypothetical protein
MISKRQRPALLGLSLISWCALQATAAVHTDPNGNVGTTPWPNASPP